VELERSLPGLREEGFGLAAISYDSAPVLEKLCGPAQDHLPAAFGPGVEDHQGLRDSQRKGPTGNAGRNPPPGDIHRGCGRPGYGQVFEEDFRQRYSVSGILADRFGKDIGAVRSEQELDYFQVTSTASDRLVARGPAHYPEPGS